MTSEWQYWIWPHFNLGPSKSWNVRSRVYKRTRCLDIQKLRKMSQKAPLPSQLMRFTNACYADCWALLRRVMTSPTNACPWRSICGYRWLFPWTAACKRLGLILSDHLASGVSVHTSRTTWGNFRKLFQLHPRKAGNADPQAYMVEFCCLSMVRLCCKVSVRIPASSL